MKHNKQLQSCVFYFFNEHEVKNKKQKIHKIVQIDLFIQNELTNQTKLLKITNIKQHFYLCENTSQLQITHIDDDDTKIKHKYSKHDDTILLEFNDRKLIYFKNYLKALSSSTKYLLTIINSYKHLLNSIHLLVSHNIFHNHINFDSIVVDKSDHILLSNFSFSIDYSHTDIQQYIKHFIVAYDPSYLEWPIEFHILSYLLTNKLNSLSSYNIESIITEYINHNNILNTFGSALVSSYKDESLKYFKKYINQTYDYILTDMLQYAHTWDNYALSILYLRILIGIHRSIGIKNKFIILFMKLLVQNIHLNPCKRISIEMTIQKFDILIDSLEPKDYKEVINNLTST
jgi:hypothetical protein